MSSLSHWNPDSAFAGFDDNFFRDYMAPSSLLGKPPSLTKFKNDTMVHASPRYEVTENEKQFRLAVDVPGVKPDHMKVTLEHDGRVLHMRGDRKIIAIEDNNKQHYEEYKFDKKFTLGRSLDTSKLTAHLYDGVLVLTAPKKAKLPPETRVIAIFHEEAPALMDEKQEDKRLHLLRNCLE